LRKSLGSDFSCPKKKCVGALKERICKSFFYINKPPVVTVTGFKTVLNNITRQYQVRATDPEGAAVQYAIDWGDGTSEETPTRYFKTGLFSHAYKDGGTYTVTGFARDVSGDVGKKTFKVFVRDARDERVCTAAYEPVCGAINACANKVCKEILKTYGNGCLLDKAHATKVKNGVCK
jgi:hypothetical protein